jgi:hypothetical protein
MKEYPDSKKYYSTFRQQTELKNAMMSLFVEHIQTLLIALYQREKTPEIRVGVAIKLLHATRAGQQSHTNFALATLEPVIKDIETMMRDHAYLRSTGEPKTRLHCLRNELDLVRSYINLDDTMSLNSAEPVTNSEFETSNFVQQNVPMEQKSNFVQQNVPMEQKSNFVQQNASVVPVEQPAESVEQEKTEECSIM